MARITEGRLRRALVVENPHIELDALLEADGFDVVRVKQAPDEDELVRLVQLHRPQVIFKRSQVRITAKVLDAAPELVAVQLCCIGDDSVDKKACAERGVLVFNDPVSNGRSVVELVLGHLVGLSRRLYETDAATHAGAWDKSDKERWEILGKTLGIAGLGNIGRQVARAAEQLGMKVIFHDSRSVAREVGVEMGWEAVDSLEALFRASDAVTLHMSATDAHGRTNSGRITRDLLMQLGAERPETSPRLLINLSRGFLFTAEDLLAAVQAGKVRRAAVDVYPEEPRNNGVGWANPYAAEPRIACTPHIGAATQEAQPRIAHRVSHTLGAFSRNGSIRDCVFSPRTTISVADDHREGRALLFVVHATTRGTKKALDEAIYEAGADNLRSAHVDFPEWGLALDVNLLDGPLHPSQLERIATLTGQVTGDPGAVRQVRQVVA